MKRLIQSAGRASRVRMPGLAQTRAHIVAQVLAGFLLTLMATAAAADSARPLPRSLPISAGGGVPDSVRPLPRPAAITRAALATPEHLPQSKAPIVTMSSRSPALAPDFLTPRPRPAMAEDFAINLDVIRRSPGTFGLAVLPSVDAGRANPVIDEADLADLDDQIETLVAHPPRHLRGASALACLAVSIYHEARDQPELGQRAVASVILRRAEVEGRWGDTICDVVQPVQFSYLSADRSFPAIVEDEPWRRSLELAAGILLDGPVPMLAEADHYHATYVRPRWRNSMHRVAQIGDHIFYRDPNSRSHVN